MQKAYLTVLFRLRTDFLFHCFAVLVLEINVVGQDTH
jgi:hypothetical protein